MARQGFPLLPLRPAGKYPYTELLPTTAMCQSSWSLLSLRPADESEIRRWFEYDPDLNYGIITGVGCRALQGNGLYVVDVDRPKKFRENLPGTVAVKTGRGSHYLFQAVEGIGSRGFPWGELKGAGGYVVGPGSVHESGHVYTFYEMLSPADTLIYDLPRWALPVDEVTAGEVPDLKVNSKTRQPERRHRYNSVPMPRIKELENLNQEEAIAVGIMRLCGREVKGLKKAFACPLPGHTDKKPSAALYHKPGRPIILHDFHSQDDDKRFWPLVDVYASCIIGKCVTLKSGERVYWWLRALHQMNIISPPIVPKYALPENTRADVKKVYAGFCYLLELRQLYEESKMAPFNRKFAARWCLTDKDAIRRGMRWLLKEGYLFISQRGRPNTDPEGPALTFFSLGVPKQRD